MTNKMRTPLTLEQIVDSQKVLLTWIKIRQTSGYSIDIDNTANLTKSCLLGRLLMGGDLLPDPPPTAHSGPWYELIDNGTSGKLHPSLVFIPTGGKYVGRVAICQCTDWEIIEDMNGSYLLDRHHRWTDKLMGESWLLDKDEENFWILTRI